MMTENKLKSIALFYSNGILDNVNPVCHDDGGRSDHERLQHLKWMCGKIIEFVENANIDKGFRWLGFIQGALFSRDMYTLDELREHSRT